MTIERINLTGDLAQWHRDRLLFANASEQGTICGEGGYGSLAELYAEKKELRPPRITTKVMRRGKLLELSCIEFVCDERPEWEVVRAMVHVRDLTNRIACTPDAFARRPDSEGIGVVQAKVIGRGVYRQKWLDDPGGSIDGPATPPTAYKLQTLTEMMLNECEWGVLAVMIAGEYSHEFQLFEIERDPVLEDRIRYHTATFFRDYLDPSIMPPFEPQRDEALIRALYPRDDGTEIDLSSDNRALIAVEELTETQAALKRMNAQEKALKTELQGKLGEHTYGRLTDGRRLSWKLQHRKGYAVEASDFRVFRIQKRTGTDD